MYYEWHNKDLNKENSLFPTILNYFRQILVTFNSQTKKDKMINSGLQKTTQETED
jgi:hypothetical protein